MGFMELLWECKRVVIFCPKALKEGAFVGWRTHLVTGNYWKTSWGGGGGLRILYRWVGGEALWIFSLLET